MSQSPVVLVTGATDGIGRETACALARRGATVLPHGRNPDKLRELCTELAALGPKPLDPLLVDFSDLSRVREVGHTLDARGVHLDVLLNNAGVFMNERKATREGYELTFAVNHLAPFALTHAILHSKGKSTLRRVVNVSSVAHTRGRLSLDDLFFEHKPFDGHEAYAASKLANVLFSVELAKRIKPLGIVVNALHPGVVTTKLLTEGFRMSGRDSLEEGAKTSVYLALSEAGGRVSGKYFAYEKEATMHPLAHDAEFTSRFFELSAKLAGVSAS